MLAQEIAGGSVAPEMLALARQLAEAQVDVMRIRQARHDLLVGPISDAHFEMDGVDLTKQLMAMDRYEQRALARRKFAIREFAAARVA